jgi:polar amino acid transport system substrate-binding protein
MDETNFKMWPIKLNPKVLLKSYLQIIAVQIFLLSLIGCAPRIATDETREISVSTDSIDTQSKKIRLTNGYWPPYNGENLKNGGCDTNIVKETFALAGYDVEFGYFPWARSYILSEDGDWDGTITWADTPQHREGHWISAEPTTIQEFVFFYRADKPFSWQTMEDLSGKIIGITTGYVYNDAFLLILNDPNYEFIESTSDLANFKMLAAGRIDIFPMEKSVGLYILNKELTDDEKENIAYSDESFSEFNAHLLLSKSIPENEQRIIEFDQAFRELKQSGRYEELILQCMP